MFQESGPDDNGKQTYVAKNRQIFQYFLVSQFDFDWLQRHCVKYAGFSWPVFSHMKTKPQILYLYGKISPRKNPYSCIFYAVRLTDDCPLIAETILFSQTLLTRKIWAISYFVAVLLINSQRVRHALSLLLWEFDFWYKPKFW